MHLSGGLKLYIKICIYTYGFSGHVYFFYVDKKFLSRDI